MLSLQDFSVALTWYMLINFIIGGLVLLLHNAMPKEEEKEDFPGSELLDNKAFVLAALTLFALPGILFGISESIKKAKK